MHTEDVKTSFGDELYSKLMGTNFAVNKYKKIQESSQELNKLAVILKEDFDVETDFTIVLEKKGDPIVYNFGEKFKKYMTNEDKIALKEIFLRTLKARVEGLYEDVAGLKQGIIDNETAASQANTPGNNG